MSYSNLVNEYVPAYPYNYTQGRKGCYISKITIHHMAGKLTGRRCAELFQEPNRQASANYCIGYDGDIVCSVDEENRAWTSSSRSNDCQAITIEVSNDINCEPWTISEAAYNSLIKLCIDICQRHNFRLNYNGTPDGSLTRHDMFAATNCPGQTLGAKFPEIEETVNHALDGDQPTPKPAPTPGFEPYIVQVTTDCLNIRQGAGTDYGITGQITDRGTYTIVNESSGNGASLWGKLKSGAGWIALDYTSRGGNTPAPIGYVLGKYVVNTFAGLNVRAGAGTQYNIVKTYPNGQRFDTYEIQGEWARTPSGWVCLNYCNLVYAY